MASYDVRVTKGLFTYFKTASNQISFIHHLFTNLSISIHPFTISLTDFRSDPLNVQCYRLWEYCSGHIHMRPSFVVGWYDVFWLDSWCWMLSCVDIKESFSSDWDVFSVVEDMLSFVVLAYDGLDFFCVSVRSAWVWWYFWYNGCFI